MTGMGGTLYYGDNYDVLRDRRIADESVDLIYLDPPFNSNAQYNMLYKAPDGVINRAQSDAFLDTWKWTHDTEKAFDEVLRSEYASAAIVLRSIRTALGESDLMAYLAMMAVRLLYLHRVLKPTGSLYLHCDPAASHYLKVLMDGVFGSKNYRAEISWRRQSAHNDTKQGRRQYGNVRDILLFYTKGEQWTWNPQYTEYSADYIASMYRHIEPETGRRYRLSDLTGPGGADKGNPSYEVMGVTRYWRYSREKMEHLIAEGRVVQTRSGSVPAYKRYLDEMPGVALQNDWDDIKPASGKESLGYPTQKPLALLERIIRASSNEGDTVLDPFCGCGTATLAAHKLGRNWIGIDITHLAIAVIEKRLNESFPGIKYEVHGTPKDVASAADLADRDKYEFQKWIVPRIGGQLYQGGKKGMDRGVDGYLHFRDADMKPQMAVISVKGGKNVSSPMIRDLKATVEREGAKIGLFLTLVDPTREMEREAAAAGLYETGGLRLPKLQILTVADILKGILPKVPFGHVEGLPKAQREEQSSQNSFNWQGGNYESKRRKAEKANGRVNPAGEVHPDGEEAGMPRRGRQVQRRAKGNGETASEA